MRSVFRKRRARLAAGALAALIASGAAAEERPPLAPEYYEFHGRAEGEAVLFAEEPRFAGQRRHAASFAIEPSLYAEWNEGEVAGTLTLFARADTADGERTHFDVREAKLETVAGDWSITAGVDTVFWGKAEAVHLVDVINQIDGVEGIDDEAALGQPMLRIGRLTDFGEVSAYYLPFVRLRTFPGRGGRLRSALPVDNDLADIRADGGRFAPSFALRVAGVQGDADFGLSAFHGVSRDPFLVPARFVDLGAGPVPTALQPVYDNITQAGLDLQYTSGPTLWKGEAILREGQRDLNGDQRVFFAATGGLEHTLYGVWENADLGLIAEYAFDSRGDEATSPFQNDVILGARLALNDADDSSVLVTGVVDHENGAATMRLEAQTRVADGWIASVEGVAFVNSDNDPLGADFQDDSFLRLKLSYFW